MPRRGAAASGRLLLGAALVLAASGAVQADARRPKETAGAPSSSASAGLPSTATAFAVRGDGVFLATHHSAVGCRRLTLADGTPLDVMHRDQGRELALLRARDTATPDVARFRDSQVVELGEAVSLMGFPFHGRTYASGLSLTNGIVTALRGTRANPAWFQVNAALQPGMSGGPVLDEAGLVIGVGVASVNERKVERETGARPQLMNYAVRGEAAVAFLRESGVEVETAAPHGRADLREVARRMQAVVRPMLCHP